MELNSVTYKLVEGFPRYRAGSDGTVWKFFPGRQRQPDPRWKQLKTPLHMAGSPKGRPVLNLVADGKLRHVYLARLILETFVGPCPSKHEACHYPDPNPLNCCVANLRWGTSKDNQRDQFKHGTRVMGERHPMCKLTDVQIKEIRMSNSTNREAAKLFGVTENYISLIRHRKVRQL